MGIRITRGRRGRSKFSSKDKQLSHDGLAQLAAGLYRDSGSPKRSPSSGAAKAEVDRDASMLELRSMLTQLRTLADHQQPKASMPTQQNGYLQLLGELEGLQKSRETAAMDQLKRHVQDLRAPTRKAEAKRRLGALNQIIMDTAGNRKKKLQEDYLVTLIDEIGIQAANRRSLRSELQHIDISELVQSLNNVSTFDR